MTYVWFACVVAGGVLVGVNAASAQPPDGQATDIVAYCRMHPDVDDPNTMVFGAGHSQGKLPKQVQATDATNWRCMDGKVLLCLNSADGGACSKKDPSRTPTALIREVCADSPGSAFVETATSGYSSSTWRCDGPRPVIIHTVPLDKRGYMRGPWVRYVVRNGVVIAPHDDDFGADPR